MKNAIICKNCNTENPGYGAICIKCQSYLRERVVNIDLWSVIWKLIETPVTAFTKIIYSEHKNFIIFLAVLLSIKYFIFSLMIAQPVFSKADPFDNIYLKYLIFAGVFFLLIFAISYIYKHIFMSLSVKTRLKDIFSVLVYSNTPVIIAFVIFFPVEMILFGDYLFTYNPSPFVLKANAAYMLSTIEMILIIWSIILSITALYAVSKTVLWSIILGIVFNAVIISLIILYAKIIL